MDNQPEEVTSVLSITNSNPKIKKQPSSGLSILTLGRKVLKQNAYYGHSDKKDNSNPDISQLTADSNEKNESKSTSNSKTIEEFSDSDLEIEKQTTLSENKAPHDSEDDMEAFGYAMETNAANIVNTLLISGKGSEKESILTDKEVLNDSEDDMEAMKSNGVKLVTGAKDNDSLTIKKSYLCESTEDSFESCSNVLAPLPSVTDNLKGLFPVNVITSIIPEIYKAKFPEVTDQTGKFVCIWCTPKTRIDVNKGVYVQLRDLLKHYIVHHKDIPLKDYGIQCKHCSAYFFHEKRLETHLSQRICFGLKIDRNREGSHKKLVVDNFMKVCNFCDMIFLSRKRFKKHLHSSSNYRCVFEDLKHHKSEFGNFDYIKCKFCKEIFLFESDYQHHLMDPTSDRHNFPSTSYSGTMGIFKCQNVTLQYFECYICLSKYANKTTYFLHIHLDHAIEEFKLNCNRCNKMFRFKDNYDDHVASNAMYPKCVDYDACRTVPIKNDQEYQICSDKKGRISIFKCPHCLEVISGKRELFSHIRNFHHLTPQWRCEDCKMTFITVSDYENHITKWRCPFCSDDQIFSLRRQLKIHIYTTHRILPETEKKTCGICNAVLKTEDCYQTHMKNLHSNELKICPFCGETDDNRINMYKHIKTYHAYQTPSEKLFSCNICRNKATFTDKNRLARHMACVHKKAERTECDICHKSFAQKATMLRHRRIHLDIKPFKCSICGLSFTQKTGMRAHKARHYNKDGTLKTAQEIETQVEIIKEQRHKLSNPDVKDNPKKRSRSRKKKSVTCKKCGFQCVSATDLDSHVCEENETSRAVAEIPSSTGKIRKARAEKHLECETCDDKFSNMAGYDSHSCIGQKDYGTEFDEDNSKDAPEYQFKCDKCFKDFVTKQRFESHRCVTNYRKFLKANTSRGNM